MTTSISDEIKTYKVSGNYIRLHRKYTFNKYTRATSEEIAKAKVQDIVCSQRLKKRKVFITNCITVDPNNIPDTFVRDLANF